MIEGLSPYPDYRDSGLPWLGRVPAHWEIKRAKSLLQRVDTRSRSGMEELLTVSSARGVVPRRTASVTMFKASSYVGYKLCWPGDLVINSLWAWAGGLGVSRFHGIVSSAYGVYRVRSEVPLLPGFVHEVVRSIPFNWELHVRSKGVWISRLQLTDESFLNAPLHVPPVDEQEAIVRFLDHANGRIEGFIRAKKKLIALLNEQKQAIIHRAVTRGLDPTATMRDSGLGCLGSIPAHWEVKRLRRAVSRIDQGVSPQASSYLSDGTSWGVLKSGCVNGGVFREGEHKQLPSSFVVDSSIVVGVGDVLVSRACGSPRLVGSTGRVRTLQYRLILSDKTFRLIFVPGIDPDFMVHAMNSRYYREQVEQSLSGADGLANNLPLAELRDFCFAVPPRAEQSRLAAAVTTLASAVDAEAARAHTEIALAREYRTRLIADVVTGQVDVREAAARLPQEEGEPVTIDDEEIDDSDDLEAEEADT